MKTEWFTTKARAKARANELRGQGATVKIFQHARTATNFARKQVETTVQYSIAIERPL